MYTKMIVVFVQGYLAIGLEQSIDIDNASVSIIVGHFPCNSLV